MPQESISFWLNPSLVALKNFDKLLGKAKLPPQYRYAILENIIQRNFSCIFQDSFELPPVAVYEAIKQKYGNHFGEHDVLISALCTYINTLQRINAENSIKFNEFVEKSQKELQASRQKFKELAEQVQLVIDDLEQKN